MYLTSQTRAFHLQSVICYFNQHRASALTRRAPLAICVQSYRTFPRGSRNIVFITSKQDSDYMNWFKTLCILLIRGYTRGEGGEKERERIGEEVIRMKTKDAMTKQSLRNGLMKHRLGKL